MTAQLDIVEHSELPPPPFQLPSPNPPCRLAACHFGIVSAIESLFNLSLSKGTGTGHPFSYLIRGQTGYFSDRAWAAARSLMNSLIREEFSNRFFLFCFFSLASIKSAVQTNEGHHSPNAASGHGGHPVCTHKHRRGEPFVPAT